MENEKLATGAVVLVVVFIASLMAGTSDYQAALDENRQYCQLVGAGLYPESPDVECD